MNLRWIGEDRVIDVEEVIVALDVRGASESYDNRLFFGYARAHGLLFESGKPPKSALIMDKKVLLLPTSARALAKRLMQT